MPVTSVLGMYLSQNSILGMVMVLPKIFVDAMALPGGAYYTNKMANLDPADVMLIEMDSVAKTNAQSKFPVIGTIGLNPCCALILYNTKTKTGIMTHHVSPDGTEFPPLLDAIRNDPTELVEVHLMGAPIFAAEDDEDFEKLNRHTISQATSFLKTVANTKNVTLKTFDVFTKPKPKAVLLDTRTGNLIRGSGLFVTVGDGDQLTGQWFDSHCTLTFNNFDGTAKELQRQKTR